jgi:hypothetical protein
MENDLNNICAAPITRAISKHIFARNWTRSFSGASLNFAMLAFAILKDASLFKAGNEPIKLIAVRRTRSIAMPWRLQNLHFEVNSRGTVECRVSRLFAAKSLNKIVRGVNRSAVVEARSSLLETSLALLARFHAPRQLVSRGAIDTTAFRPGSCHSPMRTEEPLVI